MFSIIDPLPFADLATHLRSIPQPTAVDSPQREASGQLWQPACNRQQLNLTVTSYTDMHQIAFARVSFGSIEHLLDNTSKSRSRSSNTVRSSELIAAISCTGTLHSASRVAIAWYRKLKWTTAYDMQTCWRSFSFSNVPSASIDRVFFINASIRTMISAGGANEDSTTKSAIVRPSIVVIVVLTKYLAEVIGLLPGV